MIYWLQMKKDKKKIDPTLRSMTAFYKKKGFERPSAHAKQYMLGYTAAKKGSVDIITAKKWSNRDKYGRIKKSKK